MNASEPTNLVEIIAKQFGSSRVEARRTLEHGGVKINGETITENIETTEDKLAGKEIKLGRNRTVIMKWEDN